MKTQTVESLDKLSYTEELEKYLNNIKLELSVDFNNFVTKGYMRRSRKFGQEYSAIIQTVELLKVGNTVTVISLNDNFLNKVIEVLKTQYHKRDEDIIITTKDKLKQIKLKQ